MNNMSDADVQSKMPVEAVLQHLAELRGEEHVVITNQSSARLWPRLSSHRLDFNYNPSTMSGARSPVATEISSGRWAPACTAPRCG